MFKRAGHFLLIIALVAVAGGHWIVLQSVAWTAMLAENLREGPVAAAFEKTFDGRHPCSLCVAITEGKKSEKKSEFPVPLKKWEFLSERPVFVFSSPRDFRLVPGRPFSLRDFSSEPPVPPPRSFPT